MKNKILQGDCIKEMEKLPDNSIDCIWTDPPYNINYHYNNYSDNLEEDEYYKLLDNCFKEFKRLIKPNKLIFIKQFWRNMPMMLDIGRKYFKFYNQIIWKNSSPAQPKTDYKPMYEVILVFVSGEKPDYFNDKFETRETIMPWNKDRAKNYYGKIGNLWDDIPYVYAGSIKHKEGLYVPGTNRKEHPAQHPEKLVSRSIGFCTKEGEIVLDPFGGSGTVAAVCKKINRGFIIIEKDKHYIDLIKQRLENTTLFEKKLPFKGESR